MEYRQRRLIFSLLSLLAIIALSLALVWTLNNQKWWQQKVNVVQSNQPGSYSIKRFIDGDTIEVNMNGATETVRLIGIDTPEIHRPNTPVQCYGPQAAQFTKATIGSGKVRLQADPLNTNRDRYGRLLRYVYLSDGTLLQAKIISEGYGFAYTLFPFSRTQQFSDYERLAQMAGKGLWGSCQITSNGGIKRTNSLP